LFVRVWRRICSYEPTRDIIVPLVSLSLELLSDLISLNLAHGVIFVLPSVELLSLVPLRLSFSLLAQVKHGDSLVNHIELNLFVQGAICSEGRQAVHFDQPRLYFVVNENVNSKDFKAH
jgi:hypothetical protein